MSQGSGGYDSDSVEMHPMDDCPEAQYYHMQCRLSEGGYERSPGCGSRNWGLRKQAIQNWQRRPYRNSTEGEEGDVSDVGSRTTESEVEMWEQERRAVAEVQQSAPPYHHHGRAGYRPNVGKELKGSTPQTERPGLSSVGGLDALTPGFTGSGCVFNSCDPTAWIQVRWRCRHWSSD